MSIKLTEGGLQLPRWLAYNCRDEWPGYAEIHKFSSLSQSNYIKQFEYGITYDSQLQSHNEFLLKNKLLAFTDNSIISCYTRYVTLNQKFDTLIEYIKQSILCGQKYVSNNRKFDINLSKELVKKLSADELRVIENTIDTSVFNDYNFIINVSVDCIKVFESQITMKRELILKLFDFNIEFLKQLLEKCPSITIENKVLAKDDERMKKAKQYKLTRLYPIFRGPNNL